MNEIIGATGAGCASTLIGHPLDTLKVHLQTQIRQPQNKTVAPPNAFRAAHNLLQVGGGPAVFFRGIGPPLCSAILMNTVMFSVFERVKNAISHPSPMGKALLAGVASGVATACISTPADYIKIQSQLKGNQSKKILMETLRRKNPMATLFRGHVANLGREGIFTMVYLGLYDSLRGQSAATAAESPGLAWIAATSSLTGGLAWVVSYPCDTVKTVMQASESKMTIRNAIQKIWCQGGGYTAFYRGCGASSGRAMLVTSTRMIAYEWILALLP
jgi:solute carrier family 25 carnitine/acylcarnitine transporter 20/29